MKTCGHMQTLQSPPIPQSLKSFRLEPQRVSQRLQWKNHLLLHPLSINLLQSLANFSTEESVSPLPSVEPPVAEPTETPGTMTMEIVENPSVYQQPQQPDPTSLFSYSGSKYILVDISEQHMYVYDGDALVYSFVASTGLNNATRVGNFAVQSKIPNAYGSTWNIWMPDWLGIYWSGSLENGIHALPILPNGATLWAGFLGRPISYGCVVLGTYDAQLLYDWAEIGTPVEIQW